MLEEPQGMIQTFHRYINPERSMPPEALAVHGLDDQFLKDKAFFAEVEQQRSLRLRLAFQPQRNLDVGLARGLGVDVDLDVKRRLLPRRRQRTGRVGIFERQVLHVLGEHANLRHHRLRLWTVRYLPL
jgi:hypothetical protein